MRDKSGCEFSADSNKVVNHLFLSTLNRGIRSRWDMGHVSLVFVDSEPKTLRVVIAPSSHMHMQVSCGADHALIGDREGDLFTTGSSMFGKLGNGHSDEADEDGNEMIWSAPHPSLAPLCGDSWSNSATSTFTLEMVRLRQVRENLRRGTTFGHNDFGAATRTLGKHRLVSTKPFGMFVIDNQLEEIKMTIEVKKEEKDRLEQELQAFVQKYKKKISEVEADLDLLQVHLRAQEARPRLTGEQRAFHVQQKCLVPFTLSQTCAKATGATHSRLRWVCDQCDENYGDSDETEPLPKIYFGCRICDFDLCMACTAKAVRDDGLEFVDSHLISST